MESTCDTAKELRALICCRLFDISLCRSSDHRKLRQSRFAQYCPEKETSSFRATMQRYSTKDMSATSTRKCDSVPTVVDLTQSDSDDEVIVIAGATVSGALHGYVTEKRMH